MRSVFLRLLSSGRGSAGRAADARLQRSAGLVANAGSGSAAGVGRASRNRTLNNANTIAAIAAGTDRKSVV